MIWLIAILAAPAADGHDTYLSLRAAYADWPQDYAIAVGLAYAAMDRGEPRVALSAWERARKISGGNLEVQLGRIPALVATGDTTRARAEARAAVDDHPDMARAWMLHAWAWRNEAILPGIGSRIAESSYLRAATLDPELASAWCGTGWSRVLQGDTLGARKAFRTASDLDYRDRCAYRGLATTRPSFEIWGSVFGAGLVFQDHAARTAGVSGVVQGGITLGEVVTLEATGRAVQVGSTAEDGSDGEPIHQQEGWARLAIHHKGHGAQLLIGTDHIGGLVEGKALSMGGSVWGTWWTTFRGGFQHTTYTDGRALQANVDVVVPLHPAVSLSGGVQWSNWTPDTDGDPTGTASGVGNYVSGSGKLTVAGDWGSLEVGGRGGPEYRPVRVDQTTLWNLQERIDASGFVTTTIPTTPWLDLSLSYEVMRLDTETGIADLPISTDAFHEHVLGIGFTFRHRGRL